MAGSAPVPAGQQGPSEGTLESPYTGQESLLRPEPRGSVVVVHAQKRARTGAAGAGAKTHNIHAFVHPREARESRLISLCRIEEGGGGGGGREREIKASWTAKRERGREGGKSSHLHNRLMVGERRRRGRGEEEEEEEG